MSRGLKQLLQACVVDVAAARDGDDGRARP